MKEIKEEVKTYKTLYEAIDGTLFNIKEECEKYEDSALAVLKSRFNNLISGKANAWKTIGGNEDHDVVAVKMLNEKDLDTVLQLWYIQHPWYLQDEYISYKEEFESKVMHAYNTNETLLFGINSDDGVYYFIGSVQTIINNLNKLSNG